MALHAKIGLGVVVGQVLERRAVRAMTTQTVQRQILVSRVDHLGANRVRRVPLPVVASTAQIDDVLGR